ncbi:MAG TPA: glycosyltransferase family 39 protein [Acidobacteriota bacterium]|nr:glycosyltransferase family 39 protein [Acidobacteriota bacterium]
MKRQAALQPGSQSPADRDYLFVCLIAAGIWLVNGLWLRMDSRPPVWDMALHQNYALNYLLFLPGSDHPYWSFSGVYPPFVHLVIAVCWLLFGASTTAAAYANLPATLILLWATYELASELAGHSAGRWTCLVTALIPYLFWMSRETILDYWLTAWVLAGLVLLRKTHGFAARRCSLIFGTVAALGLLTKWFFAVFIGFPVAYVFIRERVWKEGVRLTNFIGAALLSAVVAGFWYIPNLNLLIHYFPQNALVGKLEGEPAALSFQSLIYYVRLLEGYQLFGLLFVLLMVSCFQSLRRRLIRDAGFVGVTIIGAWLTMTLIRTKDPRFTMPLLPLLALFIGAYLASLGQSRPAKVLRLSILGILSLQVYMINFGVRWLPERVVLLEGYQGSLRWDWNLYMQNYFGILGPPRDEDWRLQEILSGVRKDAIATGLRPNVGLVPDLPRFNVSSFNLYARLLKIPVGVGRLLLTTQGLYPLEAIDYVVTVEGDQGMSWTTQENRKVNQLISGSKIFLLLQRFPLPNGDQAILYRVARELPRRNQ